MQVPFLPQLNMNSARDSLDPPSEFDSSSRLLLLKGTLFPVDLFIRASQSWTSGTQTLNFKYFISGATTQAIHG